MCDKKMLYYYESHRLDHVFSAKEAHRINHLQLRSHTQVWIDSWDILGRGNTKLRPNKDVWYACKIN